MLNVAAANFKKVKCALYTRFFSPEFRNQKLGIGVIQESVLYTNNYGTHQNKRKLWQNTFCCLPNSIFNGRLVV